jgi:hypothetical protein
MGALSLLASIVAFALNDSLNLPLERWYFSGDSIPHNVIIHAKVVMYQSVSHSSDGSPVDVTVLLPEFGRYVLRGFTDDFQTAYKRPLQCLVSHEPLFAQPLYVVCKVHRFVQDMTQVFKW